MNRAVVAAGTPSGVMELLRRSSIPIEGRHAVVIGRSDIVGKPMALMLLHANATVTICHSRTSDLSATSRRADILVAALGRPAFVTAAGICAGDLGLSESPGSQTVKNVRAPRESREQ